MSELNKKAIKELRDKVGYTFDKDLMKDEQGRYWTQGLFKEMSYGKTRNCIMTLKSEDYSGLISFKRVFVELGDPSGYMAAMVLLGSWDHWLKLCDSNWFVQELKQAMEELEVKLRAEALIEIQDISQGTSGSALSAAKYIASGSWRMSVASTGKVGRPKKGTTKAEQIKEKKIVSIVQQETNSDYERLGLGSDKNKEDSEVAPEGR